ncbi:phospholipase C delta isoform [Thecamonas trahens ATCC 50062]|uniref:Phosphoinositide phospholipase C n=1 Tax=Thecamonas trahens ATCC 50062 TaxID=461836 RepID=A0A0L0DIA0_THETB|nr:phospholipase C delta isoform [Thecamonas trahens ATCC 50062]KNC52059.1 phospholipase C delta isoform [Thecamonas trahens ATCC 50062]|eukprot:XP_013762065.1 phospholipase C delta isoform [Thecamonas trahens ATCC 50062]
MSSTAPALPDVDPFFLLVAREWRKADTDGDGSLNRKEIAALIPRLNLTVKKKVLKSKFNEVDVDKSGTLNFTEFMAFLNNLRNRPEINAVFAQYSGNSDHLTPEQFREFLINEQMELGVTVNDVVGLIHTLEGSDSARHLYLSGFTSYMTSEVHNSWRAPEHKRVYQNMDQPLSHYFVASSHNTYCSGDQLKGASSVEMYEYALKKGCRCVELDCWDGPDNEPLIYHGRTLTSRIKFRDVIECIKTHAFAVSDYPVILSLENHCSHAQQAVMADIMTEVFGDMLPPPFPSSRALPSPNELKHKILLKGKTVVVSDTISDDEYEYEYDEAAAAGGSGVAQGADEQQEEESDGRAKASRSSASNNTGDNDDSELESDEFDTDEELDDAIDGFGGEGSNSGSSSKARSRSTLGRLGSLTRKVSSTTMSMTKGIARAVTPKAKAPKEKVAAELSQLIHLKAVHFKSFTSELADARKMSSFSENKIGKLVKLSSAAMVDYCKRQLARVYPKGTRFDSSNYDPFPAWCIGAQLVALNYQTAGLRMWLNQGFFNDNGNSGYKLKPYYLRSPAIEWSPSALESHVMSCKVSVKSGWQLPRISGAKGDIIDPYVIVSVFGVPQDIASSKTKVVKNNGFNPVWEHETTFKLAAPELAVVLFRVMDSDNFSKDDFIAYAALPVTSIRSGYRHVQLSTVKDVPVPMASLFVNFQFT